MAYSRNEYLKQLNAMRNNYQNNGNAIINTMDDSTSVGEELSSFASMSTPLPSVAKENGIKDYKETRNGWQRTMDTMEELGTNVKKGTLNFMDSIGDFVIGLSGWVGSWFGADTQWAEDAIQYDWVSQASETTNIFNPFDILSGDIFNSNYYNEYSNVFKSPEQARLSEAKRHSGSWVSDADPNFQQGYNNITEGIGELLPSVALSFATGGTSLGAQMAIQGGVTAARVTGQSTEQALQEGANLQGALGYGATKGTIAGTITAATVGIGGTVLARGGEGIVSKGSRLIGEKIGKVFSNSATAEVIASKSAEILFRAGIDATSAGAQTLLDPVLKQITYDSEAIQKAYGSNEAIQNTLANLGNAMVQAGLTSAVLSTGKEVVSLAKAKSFEQYKENYFVNKIAGSDIKKAELYQKKYHEYLEQMNKELGIGTNNLKTEKEAIQIINKYSNKILKLNERYNIDELLNNLKKQSNLSGTSALKYEQAINNAKESTAFKTAFYSSGTVSKSVLYQYLKESGWKAKSGGTYTSEKGDFLISATDNGEAAITLPNSPNSPIPLLENKQKDGVSLQLNYPNQAIAMLGTLNNSTKVYLPSTFVYENKTYSLTKTNLSYVKQEMENKNNNLYGLKNGESALKYLVHNYSKEEVLNLNNSKSQLIVDDDTLKKYVYEVINNYSNAKDYAIIGRITNKTINKLKNDTGIDFSNFSLAYNKSYLKHIYNDHVAKIKNSIPLDQSELFLFPYIMENYDESKILSNNRLQVRKNIFDNYSLIAEYSFKKNNLVLVSLYKTKKGENLLPTSHGGNKPPLPSITSETPSGAFPLPSNSISQNKGKNATEIENKSSIAYNKIKKGEHSNDFRRIQEESLGLHEEEISEYHGGKRTLDETLRRRLSRAYELELHSRRSGRNYTQRTLLNPKTNTNVQILENVDGQVFHDIFEINRKYLKNGELVDLHDNYDDCTCYLSEDGLSGFAITKEGDLVSVFSLSKEGGFLKTIAPIVKDKAKTLDCYASPLQDLQVMYSKIFGFKTASIMDYNMEFDHDNIAENHKKPQVAFMINTNMINTNEDIETKHFNKDQYDEASTYQLSFFKAKDIKISSKGHNAQLVKDSANLRKDKVYSLDSTSKLVKNVLTNIKNKISSNVEIKLKGSKSELFRKTFEDLNLSKNTDNVIDGLIQAITESTIYFNKGESSETSGKLGDYLDTTLVQDLRTCIKDLIEHTGQKAYVKRLTEKYLNIIDKIAGQIKEQRNLGHYAKVYTNLKNKLPKYLRKDLDFTEDNETYHQLSLLLDPLRLASNSTNSYYDGGLKQKIADLLIKYKPIELDNNGEFKEGFSLFDENIRNEYQVLYNLLPDSTGENYSLNSVQLKQVVKLMRMISKVSKDSIEAFKTKIGPNAFETINAIQKHGQMPALKHLEARWDVVRSMLGDSTLADEMTNGFRQAVGKAGLKSRAIKDKVSAYIKDNKLTKTLHEKIDFYGSTIPLGSLATTYAQLLTDADYEQIDLGGLTYTNSKGKRVAGLANKTKGKSAEIKQFLEDNLPIEVKEYAQFIKNILNNELKKDYGDYYKIKYGVSDANVMEDYMFLSRQIDKMASAESMINAPKLFGNEQNRVRKSSEPIKIVDLTDSFEQYVDNLYNHMYVMPLYRDLLKTLNTKVYVNGNRINAITVLKEKFGEKNYDIFRNTMDGIAGITNKKTTLLGRFFNGWYKSTLGLKWTTIIKQNFSKFVSNYSISKITRAELKLIFGSKEFKTLLRDFETSIGEYINREKKSNTIHHYNSNNDFATKLDKVTDIFMLGISKMDKGTIRTGLAASIIAALDEGYSPNNDYFAELVVNDFTEFVLTQINSDVLGQNELGSTRFGDVFVFQGPARVALATINNKIRIWKRYHKLSSKDIDTAITQAEEEENEAQKLVDIAEDELNNAIEKLDKTKEESKNETLPKEERERRINEAKEVVKNKQNKLYEAEDKLREKKANTNSAKNDKKNFHRFKNMGGKKSILSMVTGLMMMGVGLTVVSELDQRIKGRKKWTEFDGQEILKQTAYNSTLSWIPVINTISNSVLNGYDVSLPSSTMINEVTDTLSSLYGLLSGDVSESNVKTLIRNAVNVLSNITGIPFKTIYDYIVGAISQFDPLTALRIKNVFYTMNSTAATKAYNEYVSEDWESQAKAQLLYNSNYFKGGIIDDNIAEELYTFSKYGYNAIPKDLMTSYTDIDGKVISLTKQQITQFASLYKESKKEVNNLLEISDYSSYNYYDQAKLVKKVYDTYYEYAKAKTTGTQSKNRISNILLLTNGKIGISKFLLGVNSLSTITESKTATRKELIMAQINKMTELNKSEKLLLVYLLGFSLSDKNKLVLSNYLTNHGANYKEAIEALQ